MSKQDTVLTFSDGKCRMVVTNPDERARQHWRDRLAAAYRDEINEFVLEVQLAIRHMKPGDTVKINSRPIEVTIEYPAEEVVKEAALTPRD